VSVALGIQHATRVRHIVIYGLSGCTIIFPHFLINGNIFEKTLLDIKCVFWFSLQLLSETFLILRRIKRDIITNVYRSSRKVPFILVRFWWNLNFLDRFFVKKHSNVKFHENFSSGNRVVPCGLSDRQDRHAVAYRGEFLGGSNSPRSKFWSFDKAEPNSQFRWKYIRNCLVFLFHHPN
jgi:hypothetical protein